MCRAKRYNVYTGSGDSTVWYDEFIMRGCQRAFEMAGFDTNRYARTLRSLRSLRIRQELWRWLRYRGLRRSATER